MIEKLKAHPRPKSGSRGSERRHSDAQENDQRAAASFGRGEGESSH